MHREPLSNQRSGMYVDNVVKCITIVKHLMKSQDSVQCWAVWLAPAPVKCCLRRSQTSRIYFAASPTHIDESIFWLSISDATKAEGMLESQLSYYRAFGLWIADDITGVGSESKL